MPGSIFPLVRQRVDAVSALKWVVLLGGIYAVTRNLSLILGLFTALLVTGRRVTGLLVTAPG